MALLYVTEFGAMYSDAGGSVPIAKTNVRTDQTPVVIGAGSLQSAAFLAGTRFVRLNCDAICSIAFGSNPTASTSTMRMAANQTEYFGVNAGDKVAVIANT
jgi:hypothetical protein